MSQGQLHRTLDADSIAILIAYYGPGIPIRVPWTTANASHFEILIGLAATSRLVEEFGGGSVYLPGIRAMKAKGIKGSRPSPEEVKRLSRTQTASQIARAFGCSARTVYNIRNRIKRRDR